MITLDFFILDELSYTTRLMQAYAAPAVTATNTEGMMSETYFAA